MGYRMIVRDANGFVLGRSGSFKDTVIDIEWAELIAFEESVKVAGDLNISKAVFESDCASLVNKIKKRGMDITILVQCMDKAYMKLDNFIFG
ncbi:hypothetical protein Golob_011995 [Gossypium lobatum]|uniref:RNase H type-1 domain-containing protein n=1 Tax=Gossypium lobatum TaxID=34289 RepID=A0A7J8MRM4_9ROSI|nr:hypothetical protein [Gossypium lobatum]